MGVHEDIVKTVRTYTFSEIQRQIRDPFRLGDITKSRLSVWCGETRMVLPVYVNKDGRAIIVADPIRFLDGEDPGDGASFLDLVKSLCGDEVFFRLTQPNTPK